MAEEQGVGVGRGSLTEALGAALGTAAPAPAAQETKESERKEASGKEAAPEAAPKDNAEAKPPVAQTQRPQGSGPRGPRPEQGAKPDQANRNRENRPPREGGNREAGNREAGNRPQGSGDRRPPQGDRRDMRPGGDRRDFAPEIEIEKLIGDSLYLDNQAHLVVSRMRDMDSGTRSQLRRLYNAVRRATRAPEAERQHEFVMLRARLAYTIARHGLRSLDQLERLLLQVTRRNEARGYERFRDLFEAIVAYNE